MKTLKVISSTGKVHYATKSSWNSGNVYPLCNYMSWQGDHDGQPWKETNQPVTCKSCLKAWAREHGVPEPEKYLYMVYRDNEDTAYIGIQSDVPLELTSAGKKDFIVAEKPDNEDAFQVDIIFRSQKIKT